MPYWERSVFTVGSQDPSVVCLTSNQHVMSPEFGEKWGTEVSLWERSVLRLDSQDAGYSVKLKKPFIIFKNKTNLTRLLIKIFISIVL